MTLYRVLLFVHVLAAAAWAGGALYAFLLGLNVRRSADVMRIAGYGREVGEFGGKYFAPAAVVAVLSGIWLVIDGDWGFDHFWILSAFAVWIYSIVSNVTWLAKLVDRMSTAAVERGPDDPEVRAASQQMFRWRAFEVALLVYVIFAMTYKPFA
jgi:uncharacterized membrane protein